MDSLNRMKGLAKVLPVLIAAIFFVTFTSAAWAQSQQDAQQVVSNAQTTLQDFQNSPGFKKELDQAKGVLIFPQVIKGGLIIGGSGGNGVFLAKQADGNWSQPAFFSLKSATLGAQIGGETSQIVILAMTQRAIDSALSQSIDLGVGASYVVASTGGGYTSVPNADFVVFAKSRGLYAGLNLKGSHLEAQQGLDQAYYGKNVNTADILTKNMVANNGSTGLRDALKNAA